MGKNLELFDYLEANYIPAIKESNDDKDLNEVLFKTVKYLLRHISELSGHTLSACSEREKKKIFSSFGEVAQTACEFYQASKGQLDPAALNGEIGRKLETATQEVAKANDLIKSIEKNNADLLKRKEELIEKNEAYKNMEENISRLKKIKEKLSPEVLKNLEQEYNFYNLYLGENGSIVSKLKDYGISRIEDVLPEINVIKENVKKRLERFDNILKSVIEGLEKERDEIGRRNKTLS